MYNLFNQHDEQLMENFEIIFDRAKNEKMAKSNALDYYFYLMDLNKEIDIQEVIQLAENYGWDLTSLEESIKENE